MNYIIIDSITIADKDKCVAYLQGIGGTEEMSNTYCSGKADENGFTLKDAVQRGGIPTSDYETAGLEVTSKPFNRITDVVIPNEIDGKKVVGISANAFIEKALTSIFMPDTIIMMGESAFENNQLTEVTIPNSVTSIGNAAFVGNKLTTIVIPSSVKSIGQSAFSGNQLTSITLSDGVTSIGNAAFFGNKLTTIVIPSSVTSIGRNAFSSGCGTVNCTNNNVCTCIKVSGNENLSKIINKTGRSFDWDAIINNSNKERYTFETGSVSSDNKANWSIEITK